MTTPISFSIRYLGGPTALIELGGLRLLTDPTFDPPGDHPVGNRVLHKLVGPAITPAELGQIDAVLLSHDQHPDNLDTAGRLVVATAPLTISTPAASQRLAGHIRALNAWETTELPLPAGGSLTVTAVPARHGPAGSEPLVGAVTGFVLTADGAPTIYISGDNASLEHVQAIADRSGPIDIAVLFAGAAQTALADGANLTLTSDQAAEAARILGAQHVIPLHFEHWAHFTESSAELRAAFEQAGRADTLTMLQPGETFRTDGPGRPSSVQ